MTYPHAYEHAQGGTPLVLIIPGLNGSGPRHWQSRWLAERHDCRLVEQANWSDPDPFDWSFRLNQAIEEAAQPVVLASHSLGALLVAQWSATFGNCFDGKVRGALLVAPADAEQPGAPMALTRFLPIARRPLPFRSVVVASSNDPYITAERARCLADYWGSAFVDAGPLGHIGDDIDLGTWPFGQVLLDDMLRAQNGHRYKLAASLRNEQVLAPRSPVIARPCRDMRGDKAK